MQKPWMCCHMLSALDGGISGSFMELETTEALHAPMRRSDRRIRRMPGSTAVRRRRSLSGPMYKAKRKVPVMHWIWSQRRTLRIISSASIRWERSLAFTDLCAAAVWRRTSSRCSARKRRPPTAAICGHMGSLTSRPVPIRWIWPLPQISSFISFPSGVR